MSDSTQLLGKGATYTGSGVLALYDAPVYTDNPNVIATVQAGKPIGVIVYANDPNVPDTIGFSDASGKMYFTQYDPEYMKLSATDPGQSLSSDTSWITGNSNNGSEVTITSSATPIPGTPATTGTTPTGTPVKVDGLKQPAYMKYIPWAIAALGLIIVIAIIAHHPKQVPVSPLVKPV